MDWASATFFDRILHSLWLDPDEVRVKFDLDKISQAQLPISAQLLADWQVIAPGADAAVAEFDFRAAGNAKRKLIRRLHGLIHRRRGGLTCRSSLSLKWLNDYALAYHVVAQGCGGALLGWRFLKSPLPD